MRLRCLGGTAAILAAVALPGCGLGAGDTEGGASLTVTRDYGARRMLSVSDRDLSASETVLRLLESHTKIATRYGGAFVQAIDGVEGRAGGARRFDWFFYVNGIESPIGAAEARVHPGDRIWWDHREWTAAMAIPAVVGSWPEPFLHGSEGKSFPVRIDCLGDQDDCRAVAGRLERHGVAASIGFARARIGKETLRLLVGPWRKVREDRAAALIEGGPERSGVFAEFEPLDERAGEFQLVALDSRGRSVLPLRPGSGLVAAVRSQDQQPTWLVTGTDDAGVKAAIGLLDARHLRNRYAVAISGERFISLPVVDRRDASAQALGGRKASP